MNLTIRTVLPFLAFAIFFFAGFAALSPERVDAQCTTTLGDPVLVCVDRPIPGVTSGTNGCLSGVGYVNQDTITSCEGGDVGGGGGDPVLHTPSAAIAANPGSIAQGASSALTATSEYVSSCSINNGIGAITPNTPNIITVFPSVTTTYTLTCTDFSGTQLTDTATVSVTPPTPPDLIGQVGGERTGRAGEAMTLYGVAANQGSSAAGSFPNTIQVCDLSCFTLNQTLTATAINSLASGDSSQVSASYTPPAVAGETNYMYRVCANTSVTTVKGSSTWSNPANESNYANNCSGWQYLHVQQDPVPPTATLQLQPSAIYSGGTTIVTWGSANATSCTGTNFSTGGAPFGSVQATATETTTYTVTCTGDGGSASDSKVLTVYPPLQPDLVAGTVAAGSPRAGVAATLSSIATNIGLASSGAFPVLFQVSETGALVESSYLSGLSAAGSGTAAASYTFPSPGTYQVRACANFNINWSAITTESNYSNNCGPWTNVTVGDAPQPPSLSCSVSQASILPGQSVTYSANPSGGASGPYTWSASDGGSYGTGSSVTRSFSTPGTYAMNVDTSSTAVSYCPNVTVAADWCTSGSADLTITATPTRVRAGQTATVTWSATGVNGQNATCSVSGPGVSWSSAVSPVPQCSASGSATPTINTQSTYTLTCGGASESVTVNVIPNFQEF